MSWFHRWFGLGTKEDILLTLKLRLTRWRHLLKAEESCLNGLSDICEKLSGEYLFDRQYIFSSLGQVFQKAYQVAYDTGILCDRQEEVQMYPWLDKLKERITDCEKNWPLIREGPLVIPASGKDFWRFDQVGEMASHLLEIMRKGSIDIHPGFVITIQGFLHLLNTNNLDHYLQPDPSLKATDWRQRYHSLSKGLLEAKIPGALKTAVAEAVQSLDENREPFPSFTLSPSPIRSEDLPFFPFPAWTWSGGPLDTLWDMLRSIWSQVYLNHAVERESFPARYPLLSAVVFQRQISGGETYRVQTLDPINPDGKEILVYHPINFPSLTPSNRIKSKEFRLSRTTLDEELDSDPAQESQEWNPEKRKKLAQLSLRVENYFKRVLEILWEEDRSGNFYLIQLRFQDIPLGVRPAAAEKLSPLLKEWPWYYNRQGKIVSRGIAIGPIIHMKPGQDLSTFPEGGILAAPGWCPEWKALLPKISAILVEQKPPPSLAFLARSYRIPTISQLPGLIKKIANHTVITVDAEDNSIYEKQVEPLLFSQLLEGPRLEDEPEYLLLESVLRGVDHSYSSEEMGTPPEDLRKCRTLLEGIQWARRQAMGILFDTTTWQHLVRDRWALPVTGEYNFPIYAIDLGGGLAQSKPAGGTQTAIHRTEITSTPWLSIWQGLNPLPFAGRIAFKQEEKPPIFLILSENTVFLNQSSEKDKIILDTALTEIAEFNYFFFYREKGEKEEREAGLSCRDKGPIHEIRFSGRSAAEVEEQLKQVGQRLDL